MTAESRIELTKNVLSSADALIRWAIVLNGAAAAGLLSFIGNAIDKQTYFHSWESFGTSLLIFSAGIGLALIGSAGKLLAVNFSLQIETPSESATKEEIEIYLLVGDRAAIFTIVTFVFLILSLGALVVGVYIGKVAIFG